MDEASIFFNPRSRAADEAIAVNDDGQGLFALAFFSRRQDREVLGEISGGLLDCPRRSRLSPDVAESANVGQRFTTP